MQQTVCIVETMDQYAKENCRQGIIAMMDQILGPYLSYYWMMWQSQWATDLIFTSPKDLNPIMNSLLRHAHMTAPDTRVLPSYG